MSDLIERLEKADGPDGRLDIEIYKMTDAMNAAPGTIMEYKLDHDGEAMWRCRHPPQDFGSWWHTPAYTASIDAALTLVPEGQSWMVALSANDSEQPGARVWPAMENYGTEDFALHGSFAAAPAIALCIAALRARPAPPTIGDS